MENETGKKDVEVNHDLTSKSKKTLASVKAMQEQADKELAEFSTKQTFEMKEPCEDKSGEETKVFSVDVDAKGILTMQAHYGNPFSVEVEKGETTCDKELMFKFFNKMSNIDLEDEDNLFAIGRTSLLKGRQMVADFFMLLLVSELPKVSEITS